MSNFYGQVTGSAKTIATRRGYTSIESSVQSWNGSIIIKLSYDVNGNLRVDIETDSSSSFYGHNVFSGTFEEFNKMCKEWREGKQ